MLQLGLLFTDLLHLEHPLHNELVLALLVGVAFYLALPGEVQLGLPALVERDEKVGTLVSVGNWDLRLHHLSLRSYHLLRRPFHFHGFASLLFVVAFSACLTLRRTAFVSSTSLR